MDLSFSTIWPNFYCLFGRKSCFLYLTFLVFVGCIWKGALSLTPGVPLEKQSPDPSVNHRGALHNAWGSLHPSKQDPELRHFCTAEVTLARHIGNFGYLPSDTNAPVPAFLWVAFPCVSSVFFVGYVCVYGSISVAFQLRHFTEVFQVLRSWHSSFLMEHAKS